MSDSRPDKFGFDSRAREFWADQSGNCRAGSLQFLDNRRRQRVVTADDHVLVHKAHPFEKVASSVREPLPNVALTQLNNCCGEADRTNRAVTQPFSCAMNSPPLVGNEDRCRQLDVHG
ncbi:hypothetical protein [Mycobacterium sp. 1423905.2]|uniref:hypothetical protein n=1 Tax=Mycobacterium sp. 1423905.2 TaxID=1856859 RepID=UPI0020A44DDD|nr:hypothetical protein [Mycobacterium sp. 1423905.2]